MRTIASYASLSDFKTSPVHGINPAELVPGGSPTDQDAALQAVLDDATEWINNECNRGTFALATTTETVEARIDRRTGQVVILPQNAPLIAVTDVQYRTYPSQSWNVIDPAQFVEVYGGLDGRFVIRGLTNYSLSPNLVTIQDTYLARYRTPSDMHRFASVPITMKFTYTSGYTTIPSVLKTACILYAAHIVHQRGATAITMEGDVRQVGGSPFGDGDLNEIRGKLRQYKRVVSTW